LAVQIILSQSEACEKELVSMGFEKVSVYMKRCSAPGVAQDITKHEIKNGEKEIFGMSNKPNQFLVASYWGASVD
jgi:hypothetical protein